MTQHLIQILLPIHMRDKTPVPAEIFARVRAELTERFGGVTAYSRSPATGLWKTPDDEVERDQVIMIEVVVDVFDPEWWAAYREQLERWFGQEEVHARALSMVRV
ncbi:MAG TPA: hypothetical protein VEC39_10615 [Vicinamibacterales bacterium]|nr:hypothetical protein [Vicinamibacterales bacterium]